MSAQNQINYQRIATAIEYIRSHFKLQPSLDEVAAKVHLSPAHFQKMFTDWAGTSPKKFLQFLSLEHAKNLLSDQSSIFDAALETGFSGSSRLHDLFVNIEGMTPAEYKNGGKNLNIDYRFSDTPFGKIIVASTEKGICFMAFEDDQENALRDLRNKFPSAFFSEKENHLQQNALSIFSKDWSNPSVIKLHLKGSDFQLKVWESLLKIPHGKLSTYGKIAENIGSKGASRAVGTAIGSNPVAFVIPCHRVIQASGKFGGYMWGSTRKEMMIGWESVDVYSDNQV